MPTTHAIIQNPFDTATKQVQQQMQRQMQPFCPSVRQNQFLIVGYGDSLRGDAAAGHLVAATVSSWKLETVKSFSLKQLGPELVFSLAKADYAIFVEPCAEGSRIQTTQVCPIEVVKPGHKTLHATSEPRDLGRLLALTQQFYSNLPLCWVLKIPTETFNNGQALSSTTKTGISQALRTIAQFLRTYQ